MIITEHEGLSIDYIANNSELFQTTMILKVSKDNIRSYFGIIKSEIPIYDDISNPYGVPTSSTTVYIIHLSDVTLTFAKLEVAMLYFKLLCDFEKNEDLDVLKENSSLVI